jgi:hypothetical protein
MPASKKLNIKIKWTVQQSADLSASWYEARVPRLIWTYVVDAGVEDENRYTCFLLFDEEVTFQEVRLTTKEFKTKAQAMRHCEEHLHRFLLKVKKFFL